MALIIAQQVALAQTDGSGGMMSTLIMFAAIFAIFYFMIIRPQQKRQKERDKMLSAIQKGDKVITSGGLHGTVAGIDDNIVLLQVADNVKMKFDKSAINTVVSKASN